VILGTCEYVYILVLVLSVLIRMHFNQTVRVATAHTTDRGATATRAQLEIVYTAYSGCYKFIIWTMCAVMFYGRRAPDMSTWPRRKWTQWIVKCVCALCKIDVQMWRRLMCAAERHTHFVAASSLQHYFGHSCVRVDHAVPVFTVPILCTRNTFYTHTLLFFVGPE
jgi:hypothetical protein